MSPYDSFYAAVLSAGAILWGFCGTFLVFRIQREANYYQQPVLDYETGKAKNVKICMQKLSLPFGVLLFATHWVALFGVVMPLLGRAGYQFWLNHPQVLIWEIFVGLALILGYFWLELRHYRIICKKMIKIGIPKD